MDKDTNQGMSKEQGFNQNSVILIGYHGGDATHCLSAWQSTNVELGFDFDYTQDINSRTELLYKETVKTKKNSPETLLSMLAKEGHHTPFEQSMLRFQVTADIASHIHLIKHRIGVSINSESARWKELKDKWYLPMDWMDQDVWVEEPPCDPQQWDEKTEEDAELWDFIHTKDCSTWLDMLDRYSYLGHILYHKAIEQLTPSLGKKRAKETARYFLPYNKQLDFGVAFNFRSFMHFQSLRNHPSAQKEVQALAQSMLEQVRAIPGNPFQYSLKAFGMDVDKEEGYVK